MFQCSIPVSFIPLFLLYRDKVSNVSTSTIIIDHRRDPLRTQLIYNFLFLGTLKIQASSLDPAFGFHAKEKSGEAHEIGSGCSYIVGGKEGDTL
jgi:hypothetical protein